MKESSQKNLKIEGVRRTLKITAGLNSNPTWWLFDC